MNNHHLWSSTLRHFYVFQKIYCLNWFNILETSLEMRNLMSNHYFIGQNLGTVS